jgi:hypothetical protein
MDTRQIVSITKFVLNVMHGKRTMQLTKRHDLLLVQIFNASLLILRMHSFEKRRLISKQCFSELQVCQG